jgi:hypothetical protein
MTNVLIKFVSFNALWVLTALVAKTNYVNMLVLGFSGMLLWDVRAADWRKRFSAAIILLVGMGFDFLCFRIGIIRFYSDGDFFLPKWLLALWILFGWIAPYIIFQFKDRRFIISALSSVFGPLSYYSGISFGIVEIPNSMFFPIYGVFWGLFIYLIHSLESSKNKEANGS